MDDVASEKLENVVQSIEIVLGQVNESTQNNQKVNENNQIEERIELMKKMKILILSIEKYMQ